MEVNLQRARGRVCRVYEWSNFIVSSLRCLEINWQAVVETKPVCRASAYGAYGVRTSDPPGPSVSPPSSPGLPALEVRLDRRPVPDSTREKDPSILPFTGSQPARPNPTAHPFHSPPYHKGAGWLT